MSAPIQVGRREFLAGFAASLALIFAPFERFFDGLRKLFTDVYEASEKRVTATVASMTDILKRIYTQPRIYAASYGNNPMYAAVPR